MKTNDKRGFEMNKELLKRKIYEAGNVEEVAKEIGINSSTLYRKINSGNFYIGELVNIKGPQTALQELYIATKNWNKIEPIKEYEYKEYIRKWKLGEVDGTTGGTWIDISGYIRRYIFEKYNFQCTQCGWSKINQYTGTIPLEIEHIDGDAKKQQRREFSASVSQLPQFNKNISWCE